MTLSHHPHGAGGDLRTGFSRRTSPCATGVVGLFMALIVSASAASDAQRLSALSAVESGHNDKAIGPRGEVSRYQVLPSVWRQNSKGFSPRNPESSRIVAERLMTQRVNQFSRTHQRAPSAQEWYLLWHCPARVMRPTQSDLAKATRFSRLLAGQDQPIIPK